MLTFRQKQIKDFIAKIIAKNGVAPSEREVARHFRISASTTHEHFDTLKEKGYIQREPKRARGIKILNPDINFVQIPLLGTISAGQPITLFDVPKETIAIPTDKIPKSSNVYALRVAGESMIDENIQDGDIVLIKEQKTAENGEKVVALIDNQEATLKKFYKEKNHIRLQPANKSMGPIIIKNGHDFTIQGVILDVIKSAISENVAKRIIVPEKTRVQKQDDWHSWINTIQNIDCVIGMKSIPDNSIDLVIADPPYGISKELNCRGQRLGTTAKLNFNFGAWDKLNNVWFEIALKKTKGWMMTFCAKKDVGFFIDKLEQQGFVAVDVLVWQKPDPVPLNAKSRFLNAWEAIVIGKKPGSLWNSTYEHNIIKFQAPKGRSRFHPTQKPIGLIKKLIELTTKKNDLVLDPFMGSGTTAVASIESKRKYIGFELSKNYWKQSIERIERLPQTLLDVSK